MAEPPLERHTPSVPGCAVASEIFAEDIEQLLERLDGVASARVVANESGEIERIYVTAADDKDETGLRRMVSAALMSQYSLAVDGWRIKVARLRPEVTPAQTRWEVARVEEVISTTAARITVELQAQSRGGVLVGRAQGTPDAVGRRRIAALATLDALKPVLESEGRKATIETISSTPFSAGDAIMVALSVASTTRSDLHVGAAIAAGNDGDAVVAATLDAFGKRAAPAQRGGWVMKDRREQLEALRAHYRSRREPQRHLPALSNVEQPAPTEGEQAELRRDDEPILSSVDGPVSSPDGESDPPRVAATPGDHDDVLSDVTQIRPERPGGAAVTKPSDAGGHSTDHPRAAPKGAMEDEYYHALQTAQTRLHIRCRDGYEIFDAVLKDFGTFSLLVQTLEGEELLFKHAIISIRPLETP